MPRAGEQQQNQLALSMGDVADEMSRSDLKEEIKANIDYDIIVENKQNDKRQIDEIVMLMLDTICSPSPTVRINGTDISKSAVKERLLRLDSEHNESWFCCRSHFAIVND